jgi:hypothetical protein
MPFSQYIPRPLTTEAIRAFAPATSGLYGVSNAHEWLFIGETDDIQGALLSHLRDGNAPLMKKLPTGFVFEVCDRAGRPARQDRLVSEYGPACNRASPPRW